MTRKWTLGILLGVFLILTFSSTTLAIPAFARKYNLSCNTCHAPIPKLKPYGDDFAGAGFILQEEENPRDYISAGDDLLWLNRDFPLAVRLDAYGIYESDTDVETDLQTPWGLKFMSGGTLYKNIGYYFYFYMSERGEVAGIEDAYVHFDNIFNTNFDVMLGQFQTSDPLMKRELRMTFEDYVIYTLSPGMSYTTLKYDRGLMLVYGVDATSTDIIGLVVNGNGKEEAGSDLKFDEDKYKNFGLRINQGLGKIASIGGFYYNGKEHATSPGVDNTITYYGPDFNVSLGVFEMTGQYLMRTDSNPYFNISGNEIETTGLILEAIFAPQKDRSRWWFIGLYNRVDSDLDFVDYETFTFNTSYLLARNLKFMAEYTRDIEFESNRFTLGLVSGF